MFFYYKCNTRVEFQCFRQTISRDPSGDFQCVKLVTPHICSWKKHAHTSHVRLNVPQWIATDWRALTSLWTRTASSGSQCWGLRNHLETYSDVWQATIRLPSQPVAVVLLCNLGLSLTSIIQAPWCGATVCCKQESWIYMHFSLWWIWLVTQNWLLS